ncbi:MAG: ATP-binding protein [Candidatus Methanomethylophilaceae archaeon]
MLFVYYNSALINKEDAAYLIWGVEDETHNIVGTSFDPNREKVGSEELLFWLRKQISNNLSFFFTPVVVDGFTVVVLTVTPPAFTPATFSNNAYIRDGSNTTLLSKLPQMSRRVWDSLNVREFELTPIKMDLDRHELELYLDYASILEKTGSTVLSDESMIDLMAKNRFIIKQLDGQFSITYVGAILFAKDLRDFDVLMKKTIRLVQYQGTSKSKIVRQIEENGGYATQLTDTMRDLSLLIPTEQVVESGGLMVSRDMFPIDVVRELLANAMMHQDLHDTRMYLTIEVFADRIEVTNPGGMIIDRLRVIDWPSVSRNRYLPACMRMMKMCEEMGSGWDRMVERCEELFLPAPRLETEEAFTRVTLFCERSYTKMSKEDRLWACYLHACSLHKNGKRMTNSTLRSRFGLESKDTVAMSRLLSSACDEGLIKVYDEEANTRGKSYIPFWAS